MENRNELSDIVLEKGDNKTVKMKRVLILVAFLILVFLVALASMKVANKGEKDTSKLILPPEPTQETQVPKDDQLFKQVPIIEENPKKESFEDMIKTLKDKEAQKQEEAKGSATETKPKEVTPTATTPVKEPAPAKVKEEPKKEATKPQPMLRSTEVTPSVAPSASSGSGSVAAGIYVQVGAVATAPDAKQLNDIKSKGFECKPYTTVVNGNKVVKLLVGPYATSAEAENALSLIRSSVNKNAFIYRVK